MKPYKSKLKLNIDQKHFRLMLIGIALFIIVSTIFLVIYFGTNKATSILDMTNKYNISKSKAIFLLNLSHFGTFVVDWVVVIVFLYSLILGLRKVEYGNGFLYSWMIGWLVLAILPFSFSINNNLILIKTIILLIPIATIFLALLLQTNDLRWYRKNDAIRKTRARAI